MEPTLRQALGELERAIRDEGPEPRYHRVTMRRHRRDWPTLWAAVDRVMHAYRGERDRPAPATCRHCGDVIGRLPTGSLVHVGRDGSIYWYCGTELDDDGMERGGRVAEPAIVAIAPPALEHRTQAAGG